MGNHRGYSNFIVVVDGRSGGFSTGTWPFVFLTESYGTWPQKWDDKRMMIQPWWLSWHIMFIGIAIYPMVALYHHYITILAMVIFQFATLTRG